MSEQIKKAVILAGGLGTRLSEETSLRPKPMVEIGGRPILWHIMKIYAKHGIREFIVCLGYKGYIIKEYFQNYFLHNSDVSFDFERNETIFHSHRADPWKVTLIDTGEASMTGGRLKRIAPFVGDETFCMTYGDGVSDVNIQDLLAFHRDHRRLATMTIVRPEGRFGAVDLDGDCITGFREKPRGEAGWINAGFFVLSPKIFDYIQGDQSVWEREPLEQLAKEAELHAYRHEGFWQPMDTIRDKHSLEALWMQGAAPWMRP